MRLHQPTDSTIARASAAQPHPSTIDQRDNVDQAADRAPDRLTGDLPIAASDPGEIEYESWLRLLRRTGSHATDYVTDFTRTR